jgi:hypothetical protein
MSNARQLAIDLIGQIPWSKLSENVRLDRERLAKRYLDAECARALREIQALIEEPDGEA